MSAALVKEDAWIDGFEVAAASFAALVGRLKGDETSVMSLSDLETFLDEEGREVLRQLLQAHLDRRAEAKATTPVVGADGVERTHHREGQRELETLVGTVEFERDGHGARGRETLFPLDEALNLPPEKFSFGIRRRAAEEATKGSYDEVVSVLSKYTGADGGGGCEAAGRRNRAASSARLRQLLLREATRVAETGRDLELDSRPHV